MIAEWWNSELVHVTFFHLLDLKIHSAPFFESAKMPVALYPYMMEGTETFGGDVSELCCT